MVCIMFNLLYQIQDADILYYGFINGTNKFVFFQRILYTLFFPYKLPLN
jgi:hypothetical protein